VPTDPFVPITLDDEPRQAKNLAPGVHMPPARAWRADRPGDLGASQPKGSLLGNPGPNVGYALTLAHRAEGRMMLEPNEHRHDAVAVVAAIAMKRAATFGRAPVPADVEFALELLGYLGDAPDDVRSWRPQVIRSAGHDYSVQRAVVDTVSAGLLRLPMAELPEHLAAVREAMARAAEEAGEAELGEDVDVGEDVDATDPGEDTGDGPPAPGAAGDTEPPAQH
jgi:hypothetical protein